MSMDEYIEEPVIDAAKRLGVQWAPWMDDWFTSWSPRNDNNYAEGTWFQWAHLAARILAHPMTAIVAPDLHRPDLPAREDIYTESDVTLTRAQIAELTGHPERTEAPK